MDVETYTVEQLCLILHTHRRTVYRMIETGQLQAFRLGRQWRVTREALEKFMNSKE